MIAFCCCPPNPDKAWHNEYIRTKCQEIAEEWPSSSTERIPTLDRLVTELSVTDPYLVRDRAYLEMPFMLEYCPRGTFRCCGACNRKCPNRCTQDALHRVALEVYSTLAGKYLPGKSDYLNYACLQFFLQPERANRVTLLALVEEIIGHYKQTYREAPLFSYSPRVAFRITEGGRTRYIRDEQTGRILIEKWPQSGLCPYCLPRLHQ